MAKNPKHTCWLLCAVGAAYESNSMIVNDNIDVSGSVRIGETSKPNQRYGSTCRSKDGCSPDLRNNIHEQRRIWHHDALIYFRSENMPAQAGTIQPKNH
ncbi:hypothetical protein DRO03_00835 [Methanosarcinales archaeon]|nr:MAG: hypothetical protein DRO03_00835 [Methanosarcinales archaeon]